MLLQQGLNTLQRLTESCIGFIHFVSEDQNEIELVTWSTDTLAHYCHAAFDSHYPVSEAGIWADSIRLKHPIIINDYAAAPGKKGLPEGHSVLQRFISAPIFEGNLVRMIVGVGNAARDYAEHDVDTATLFGNDLYRIVKRRRAEEEVRRLNQTLEKRVAERTAELTAANKELDSFAYSVSHDLRAPLRSIDGFATVLEEDYAAVLDGDGRDALQRVRAAAQRMGALIDDLLSLSRLSRADMNMEAVDLGVLAASVADTLRQREPQRSVVFDIAPKLEVRGDRQLLMILLENLLGNAWKFTGKHAQARIEIGVTEKLGKPAYFVRDDGAGFDMLYAAKLFTPFQRLHNVSDFPGTGIGLATVRRIVNRHGGSVWAEGAVDKGATFYFTLST
jgi:light-regulated signal transduction histidine kinase (bacteriophytochrome)